MTHQVAAWYLISNWLLLLITLPLDFLLLNYRISKENLHFQLV